MVNRIAVNTIIWKLMMLVRGVHSGSGGIRGGSMDVVSVVVAMEAVVVLLWSISGIVVVIVVGGGVEEVLYG